MGGQPSKALKGCRGSCTFHARPRLWMKPKLDPAIIALYFNLAAGEKSQLSYEEQHLLKGCMESAFPTLRHEARRLSKKMPRPAKTTKPAKKRPGIMPTIFLIIGIVALAYIIWGCDILKLTHAGDHFKHPGAGWRGMNNVQEIDLTPAKQYYYYLLQEWEGLYWRGATRTYKDIDTLGEES